MAEYQLRLTEFLELTENIYVQAKAVQSKMEDNDAEHLEAFQNLFEKRQHVIGQLDAYIQNANFQWTDEDRKTIAKLKDYEQKLQPLLNGLHQSFLTQMNRISQTKQMSKKYIGAYQNTATEGSFIDQRK